MTALRLGRYRPVALLMLVLHLGSCTTWRPIAVSPQQFIEEEQPDRIGVWQEERATELHLPVIEGDTITRSVSLLPFGAQGQDANRAGVIADLEAGQHVRLDVERFGLVEGRFLMAANACAAR